MNKERRKILVAIYDQLENYRDRLDAILAAEEDAKENIPENLWGSEKYERAETACDNLTEAISSMDEAIQFVQNAAD